MPVNLERMQRRLAALTTPALGGTPAGGMNRLALTDADRAARDLLVSWLAEEGLAHRIDDFGNIYGHRPGMTDNLPPVLVGSHLDTVPGGGRFDGILGVVAALEVCSILNERQTQTRHPVELVNWTNEEGARFTPAMLASGAVTGVFDRDWVYARTDRQGFTFGEELARIGYQGEAAARPQQIAASLELHIEQGPILEAGGEDIGIVEGVVGIRWCNVIVHGQSAHAGPTPMTMRQDALVAAARMVVAARDLARQRGDIHATVGVLTPEPGVINVIPPTVTFSLDLRSKEQPVLEAVVQTALRQQFDQIASEEGVTYELAVAWAVPPTPFAVPIIQQAAAHCQAQGYRYRTLWAGAGHDSQYIARIAPAAMLFVPTIGGLSHCETEDAPWAAIGKATEILLLLTTDLANAE